MIVAVVYEESYVLYGDRHERSIADVIHQTDDESRDEFYARISKKVNSMKSRYSYYEYESFDTWDGID